MTYTQACDEIFELIESVCANYDYYTLTEAAEETPQENKKKTFKFVELVKTAFGKIIDLMRTFLGHVKSWMRKHFKFMDNVDLMQHIKLSEDLTVCDGAIKLNKRIVADVSKSIQKFPEKSYSGSFDTKVNSDCNNGCTKKNLPAGTKMSYTYKDAYNYIEYIEKSLENCKKHIMSINVPEDSATLNTELGAKKELLQNFSNYTNCVVNDIREVISSGTESDIAKNAKSNLDARKVERQEKAIKRGYEREEEGIRRQSAKDQRSQMKDWDKEDRAAAKAAKKAAKRSRNDESVEYQSDDELRAYCLMEAARLLTESDELCQADIDDIPEERPIVDDEYPAEVSGGDGYREDHLEDIKDLVDGNQKALDILTSDDDSKIIEESIMEFDF